MSRKTEPGVAGARLKLSLQWGRDEGVAEDKSDRGIGGMGVIASMGPRRGCRGRRFPSKYRAGWCGVLQWGRDEGVAEDRSILATNNISAYTLQWGRDEGVAEDSSWG